MERRQDEKNQHFKK